MVLDIVLFNHNIIKTKIVNITIPNNMTPLQPKIEYCPPNYFNELLIFLRP